MNDDWTDEGGWAASGLRRWLRNVILPAIPEAVRNRIVTVQKKQKVSGRTQTTEDALWIPDNAEVFGGLYADLFQGSTDRAKKRSDSAAWWWLRSACYSNSFSIVTGIGSGTSYGANGSGGVALGFCL